MLTVLGVSEDVYIDPKNGYKYKKWDCLCDCGKVISLRASALKNKYKKTNICSCGCQRNNSISIGHTKHGDYGNRLYNIWLGMKKRCCNPNCKAYSRYGGRGIKICKDWEYDYDAFKKWALQNGYDDTLTIDRKNNDGDYCPDNCRWVDYKTQSRNRSSCHYIEIDGIILTMTEWAKIYNIPYYIVNDRINDGGWEPIKALSTPIIKQERE